MNKPTDKELEILQILWRLGPSTVRTINKNMESSKEIGYTTTLKIMQIMHEKGLLSRQKEGRTHIYTTAVGKDKTRKQLLNRLLDKAFQGSAKQMIMQLLNDRKASEKELLEIRDLIDQMNKK